MADSRNQLEAYKATASRHQAELHHATTKDEALNLAISAAEVLMKAMKLASAPDEKAELKSQCRSVMDIADQIKSARTWESHQLPGAHPDSPLPGPVIDVSTAQTSPRVTETSSTVSTLSQGKSQLREDAKVHTPLPRSPPATAAQVHRLREPVSTRKRATKEEILLLRASVVNGCKFPPWDKNPSSSEFVLEEGSELFTDSRELSLSEYQQQFFAGWARPDRALPPPLLCPNGREGLGPQMASPQSIDLVQDAATDCSVVASLCAGIARAERGHEKMLSNMIWPHDKDLNKPEISPNGKYVVRLNFNGCWRRVVIDDRLPLSNNRRLLHVIDRHNPCLLWPALIEKAYLKVRGGYDFPGSNSCSDLWTLTGWIPEEIYLQETETVPAQLWSRVHKAFLYGDVLVTVGTGKMSTRQEREVGLEGHHSYVVLDMIETESERLVLIKNPWAEGKGWRGPRPPATDQFSAMKSSQEEPGQNAIHSTDAPQPTTFWIGFDQVTQHFERLYLNWNPGLFRYRQDIHFDWTVGTDENAGVCIANQPQFSFSSKGADPVWFLLSRHFTDDSDGTKTGSSASPESNARPNAHTYPVGDDLRGYMSIFVCNGNGQQLYMKESYLECTPHVSTPQCLLRWKADADMTYTVVVDQAELPASKYNFTLSAFSNSAIALEPAVRKYPFQKMETGSWTRQTAGGDTRSSRYFENPQYTLEMRERSSVAILLTASNHSNPMHVKLALGYGKRIYRLQSRDVLADSGDYRDGCVFAEARDLEPGVYTIICSLFEANRRGDYSLRIDSTSAVGLTLIPRDGAGLVSRRLPPACFGSTMHKVAMPLYPERLATYTMVARFVKARSPLRLSVEQGRGPERRLLAVSERGEYSDTTIVRSDPFDLEPRLLHQGELWVVLDRLTGPGGPVEEWYEVEVFTNMANAFGFGVWREWDD